MDLLIDDIYTFLQREGGEDKRKIVHSLCYEHFINTLFEKDPVTHQALYSSIDDAFIKINSLNIDNEYFWWNDNIESLISYALPSIYAIISSPHTKLEREHIITKSRNVRKTDKQCMNYLAKMPGFSVKQKVMSNNDTLMGLFYADSLDVPENRLLKALLIRLNDIIYEKEKLLKSYNISPSPLIEEFSERINGFMQQDGFKDIGRWTNLPPNNALLNDKNYRIIWITWNELNNLSDEIKKECENETSLLSLYSSYCDYASLSNNKDIYFLQCPLFFDKDNNDIRPFTEDILCVNESEEDITTSSCTSYIHKGYGKKEEEKKDYACFDFNSIRYSYCTSNKEDENYKNDRSKESLIYQKYKDEENSYDILCSTSKYISLEKSYKTITINDFFKKDYEIPSLIIPDTVASLFSKSIKNYIKAKKYIYLVPDEVDDFSQMQISLRRQLNLTFSSISPLPRSIAKMFNLYKEGNLKDNDRYSIIDSYEDKVIITEIDVKKDKKLSEKTNGRLPFVLYRHCPLTFDINEKARPFNISKDDAHILASLLVDEEEIHVEKEINSQIFKFIDEYKKKNEGKRKIITIRSGERICDGAMFYLRENEKVDTPLWKEYLPPLSLKLSDRIIPLVDNNTPPITPSKGVSSVIDVKDKFIMPNNKPFYEFNLIKGKNKNEKGKYYAYLSHPSFPLEEDVTCSLVLTYTYGKEHPYELKFKPYNEDFPPFDYVKTQWFDKTHEDELPLPSPGFCVEYTWDDMYHFKGRKPKERNLIDEWLLSEFIKIIDFINFKNVNFKKSLRFPILTVWNQGRSIKDKEIQENKNFILFFNLAKNKAIDYVTKKEYARIEQKDEFLYFLCVVSKDLDDKISEGLKSVLIKDIGSYNRHLIYLVGDLTKKWQQDLFNTLITYLSDNEKDELVLYTLASSLWRDKNTIKEVNEKQISDILGYCDKKLQEIEREFAAKQKELQNAQRRAYNNILIIILALLRKREENNEKIKNLLSPYKNKIIKSIYQRIVNLSRRRYLQMNKIFISFEIKGDKKDKTEIQYVVEKYLMGNIMENEIKILEIDSEDE